MYKLVIFDLDGTLARPFSGSTFRKPGEDYVLLPGRAEKIRALADQGVRFGIATNQGGIAYGILDIDETYEAVNLIAAEVGIGLVEICPHHPKGTVFPYQGACRCRKPQPGMLQRLMNFTQIEPEQTLFVGDREEDKGAAEAAGVAFAWAADFFADGEQPASEA